MLPIRRKKLINNLDLFQAKTAIKNSRQAISTNRNLILNSFNVSIILPLFARNEISLIFKSDKKICLFKTLIFKPSTGI